MNKPCPSITVSTVLYAYVEMSIWIIYKCVQTSHLSKVQNDKIGHLLNITNKNRADICLHD